jgi:hypothetical protein
MPRVKQGMLVITDSQREQLVNMYMDDNHGHHSFEQFMSRVHRELGTDAILVLWKDMTVGIETDGYRHT